MNSCREHPRRLVMCWGFVSAAWLYRGSPIVGPSSRTASLCAGQSRFPGTWVISIYHFPDCAVTMHTTPCVGDLARVYLFDLTTGEVGLPVLCPGSRTSGRGSYRPLQDVMRRAVHILPEKEARNTPVLQTISGVQAEAPVCEPPSCLRAPVAGPCSRALTVTQTAASVTFPMNTNATFSKC